MNGYSDSFIDLVLLAVLFFGLWGWWLSKHGSLRSRIAERALGAAVDHKLTIMSLDEEEEPATFRDRLDRRLAALGDRIPFFDGAYRLKLHRQMVQAGYRGKYAVSILLAIKLVVGVIAAVTIVLSGRHLPLFGQNAATRLIAMMGAFILGMIIPEYVVKWRGARRRSFMAGCLPDALDLLVICTNAGNSFVVSMKRVGDELATICPPLSDEFILTADEIRLSGDTTRSLEGLASRVDIPAIRALIATLTQSMRYGTPVTQSLRVLSRTERLAHIVSLEEKAAKLAPKMVLPMMLFILPPVIVISAGPAALQLLDYFHSS